MFSTVIPTVGMQGLLYLYASSYISEPPIFLDSIHWQTPGPTMLPATFLYSVYVIMCPLKDVYLVLFFVNIHCTTMG